MKPLSESNEVPPWLQRAVRVVARFMENNSIRSYSSLHKETGMNYRTLKKLDPNAIDLTISFEAVVNIVSQLGYYLKENAGKAIGEDDDYEGLDTELMNITMEYFGKKKAV